MEETPSLPSFFFALIGIEKGKMRADPTQVRATKPTGDAGSCSRMAGQMADISSSSHHSITPRAPLKRTYVPLKLPKVSTPCCFRNSGVRVIIEKLNRKRSPKNSSAPTSKSATTISFTTLLLWQKRKSQTKFRFLKLSRWKPSNKSVHDRRSHSQSF